MENEIEPQEKALMAFYNGEKILRGKKVTTLYKWFKYY
jgi:hypothetical protein